MCLWFGTEKLACALWRSSTQALVDHDSGRRTTTRRQEIELIQLFVAANWGNPYCTGKDASGAESSVRARLG